MRRFPSLTRTTAVAWGTEKIKGMVVKVLTLGMVISVSLSGRTRHPRLPRCHKQPVSRGLGSARSLHPAGDTGGEGCQGRTGRGQCRASKEQRRGEGCSGGTPLGRMVQLIWRHPRVSSRGLYLPGTRQEVQQRARQRLIAVEGAVVRPDSGRGHEVAAGSFGRWDRPRLSLRCGPGAVAAATAEGGNRAGSGGPCSFLHEELARAPTRKGKRLRKPTSGCQLFLWQRAAGPATQH